MEINKNNFNSNVNNDNLKNIIKYYKSINEINNLQRHMTLEDLKREFKQFEGNYIDVVSQFHSMDERQQKLFILYSMFYFEQYFYIENMESIITEELYNENRKFAKKFCAYGSYTGCDIRCGISINEPTLFGVGYNISLPLESNYCIKNIDDLSIEILASVANSGFNSKNDEEEIFNMLNQKKNQEFDLFKELLSSIVKSKR